MNSKKFSIIKNKKNIIITDKYGYSLKFIVDTEEIFCGNCDIELDSDICKQLKSKNICSLGVLKLNSSNLKELVELNKRTFILNEIIDYNARDCSKCALFNNGISSISCGKDQEYEDTKSILYSVKCSNNAKTRLIYLKVNCNGLSEILNSAICQACIFHKDDLSCYSDKYHYCMKKEIQDKLIESTIQYEGRE